MNRVIKIRVWDDENKKMVYPNSTNIQAWWGAENTMLFIGLKDNKGKEAYDKDIIIWHGHYLTICWDIETAGFCLLNAQGNTQPILGMLEDAEIIGNIYEGKK